MAVIWHMSYLPKITVDDQSPTPAVLRNELMRVAHGVMRSQGKNFALYLDNDFEGIRFFSENRDELEAFAQALSHSMIVRDYFKFPRFDSVDSSTHKHWVSLIKFKIPTVKSDRNAIEGNSQLRERRLQQAKGKPFIQFRSERAGNYCIHVNLIKADSYSGLRPNSYGLARQSALFAVPLL